MSWRTIEIERRYADPNHASDWKAEDRPPWIARGPDAKRAFREWVSRRLDELAQRVQAEWVYEIEPSLTPERFAEFAAEFARSADRLSIRVEDNPDLSINDLIKLERRRSEPKRRGPTRADPGERQHLPAAQAALDMWRIRKVIFPRFWPEEAKGDWRRDKLDVARIAAERHLGTTPEAAFSWYENERLASL